MQITIGQDEHEPDEEQQHAIELFQNDESFLLTGVAGTGKSWTVKEMLKRRRAGQSIAITASTGIAACHIGGMTIHRWCGMGIGKDNIEWLVSQIWWQRGAYRRINNADTVILDEFSMLGGRMMDLFDDLCRIARNRDEPFGGLQIILVGDVGQLPPVDAADDGYPFESGVWRDLNPKVVELTHVHRQEDQEFVKILNEVRLGIITVESTAKLNERAEITTMLDLDGTEEEQERLRRAVRIVTHNKQADAINAKRLRELPGDIQSFRSIDMGDERVLKQLDRHCLAPKNLELKVGAHVMFVKNHSKGMWVNGTTGIVTGYAGEPPFLFPTVHTSDGFTVVVRRDTWTMDGKVIEVDEEDQEEGALPPGAMTYRHQFPMRLAWAISAHKSQGCSLDSAHIDVSRAFAHGQAYVALSRVRSLDGLYLDTWDPSCIKVDPKVLTFLRHHQ